MLHSDLSEVPPSETERFRLLVEHSPDMVSIYRGGRLTFVSAAYQRILGYDLDDLADCDPMDLVHPEDRERITVEIKDQISGRRAARPFEYRLRCQDGRYCDVESFIVDLSSEPSIAGMFSVTRDIRDRTRSELLVKQQADVLEMVARGAPLNDTLDALCLMVERWVDDAVAVVRVRRGRGARVEAAPSIPGHVRAAIDELSPQPTYDHLVTANAGSVAAVAHSSAVVQLLADAGFQSWWAAPISSSSGEETLGAVTALLPTVREPTPVELQLLASVGSLAAIALERDDVQSRLAYQASHDVLTGLPNRDFVVERLRAITRRATLGVSALYFLDLDRFKVFNDSGGHEMGDRILVDVAERLRATVRSEDAVARFGGDEFVVVCQGLADRAEVMTVAERLLAVVSEPFVVEGMDLVVTASIGVALVNGDPPEALLRDADTAMYHAKERGRARVEVFDGALRERVVDRLQIERDLRRALDTDELVLHYQPLVSLRTGRFRGFEALVRWNHPTRGVLRPDQFLDIAEDAGLLTRIGPAIRRAAVQQWVEWHDAHPEWGDFLVGVNLAAPEVRDESLPAQVAALLRETGADPHAIVFEASERVLASDTDAARSILGALHDLGVLLALDDFGTGSSPLLHLRHFPIHAVKLDLALVAGVGLNRDDDVIATGVIELAHRLGLFVVAEGVESVSQAETLRRHGCLLAQGHYFAPAMPPDRVPDWVARFGTCGPIRTPQPEEASHA